MPTKKTNTPRYITFKQFHIAPLEGVFPDDIIHAATLARTKHNDREDLKHVTALNHIAKSLGFQGGFSGYKDDFENNLKPFMVEHGLIERSDLVRPQSQLPIISLKPAQLADRLFRANKPIPKRVFTGFDVDWNKMEIAFYNHRISCGYSSSDRKQRNVLVNEVILRGMEGREWTPEHPVNQAVESIRLENTVYDHLLGDHLLKYDGVMETALPRIYFPHSVSELVRIEETALYAEMILLFNSWTRLVSCGWVDILPYNQNLIFLRGSGGRYDFLVRKAKDEVFEHNVFAPHLKNSDVPKSNDKYHFNRWLYFEYEGWFERDKHLAEITFYENGGTAKTYPGEETILRDYFISSNAYREPRKLAGPAEGFFPVSLKTTELFVSELITISELRQFMEEEELGYFSYRKQLEDADNLLAVNADSGDLPASVTWYDANAYAAWISKTKRLPVRLLKTHEYDEFYRQASEPLPLPKRGQRLCPIQEFGAWFDDKGTQLDNHPPYMEPSLFQKFIFRFAAGSLDCVEHPCGLMLARSSRFGEWLFEEGTAVNTAYLGELMSPDERPRTKSFSSSSTGKYKSVKIGFRLCYLADTPNEQQANSSEVT